MKSSLEEWQNHQRLPLQPEQQRHRVAFFVYQPTEGTRYAPSPPERVLLDQYVRGELSQAQLLTRLEVPQG